MKTQEDIMRDISILIEKDPFRWAIGDFFEFLTFEQAKSTGLLDDKVTKEEWKEPDELTEEHVKRLMIDYMDFAWGKANNCRGLSAARSMDHYHNWLWLLGEDDFAESILEYEHYGKPQLRRICEYLGLDADKWDDGVRVNSEEEL